jgi:hypothetical protein
MKGLSSVVQPVGGAAQSNFRYGVGPTGPVWPSPGTGAQSAPQSEITRTIAHLSRVMSTPPGPWPGS